MSVELTRVDVDVSRGCSVKDKQKSLRPRRVSQETSSDQLDDDDDQRGQSQHIKQFFTSTPRRHARANPPVDDRPQPWIDERERKKSKPLVEHQRANTFAHPDLLPYSAIRLNVLHPIPAAAKAKTKK